MYYSLALVLSPRPLHYTHKTPTPPPPRYHTHCIHTPYVVHTYITSPLINTDYKQTSNVHTSYYPPTVLSHTPAPLFVVGCWIFCLGPYLSPYPYPGLAPPSTRRARVRPGRRVECARRGPVPRGTLALTLRPAVRGARGPRPPLPPSPSLVVVPVPAASRTPSSFHFHHIEVMRAAPRRCAACRSRVPESPCLSLSPIAMGLVKRCSMDVHVWSYGV